MISSSFRPRMTTQFTWPRWWIVRFYLAVLFWKALVDKVNKVQEQIIIWTAKKSPWQARSQVGDLCRLLSLPEEVVHCRKFIRSRYYSSSVDHPCHHHYLSRHHLAVSRHWSSWYKLKLFRNLTEKLLRLRDTSTNRGDLSPIWRWLGWFGDLILRLFN